MEFDKRVVLKDTAEKYAEMADKIVKPFLKLMEDIVDLEDAANKRLTEMEAEKKKMGIADSIVHPHFKEFMNEYHEKYKALAAGLCTKKLLDRPFGRSVHNPAKYIDAVNGPIYFTMKSAKKATIEIVNDKGACMKHRFVLVNEEDAWKIDEVKYGFGDKDKWYIDSI